MKKTTLIFHFLFTLFCLFSCSENRPVADVAAANDPSFLHRSIQRLNDVVIYEIFSPPVSSRIYSYASLAAFESIRWADSSYESLTTKLNGFPAMPVPEKGKKYQFTVAAIEALFNITLRLTFTKDSSRITQKKLLDELKATGIDEETFNNSIAFGDSVANTIWKRAVKDQYKETRGMPRYSLSEDSGKWKNTSPDYLDAVEPFWTLMKPLVMDSSSQFKPVPPPKYDTHKGSRFLTEVMEVYDTTSHLTEEQKTIARFWDDNAAAVTHVGHMMYANKKPSPGGHWMNITAIASKKTSQSIVPAALAYAMTSIAMYDAFISCWDEKFRSEYIRPVTIINDKIDKGWQPLLQTPPFPEYTSGHSVASSTIATVLTHLFGDNFAFTDNYELPYIGIQRSFPSFFEASNEACISRMYGGIHFRSAIFNGKTQGRQLGAYINLKVNPRSIKAN